MNMLHETTIAGHPDQWVALVNDTVIASSTSFSELVKLLEQRQLMHKAIITHVNGAHTVFS